MKITKTLPSLFQINEKVEVLFTERPMIAIVLAVHFFKDSHKELVRIKYDLEIRIAFEESTIIYNIDEKFISPYEKPEYVYVER